MNAQEQTVFDMVVAAARAGQRCPQREDFDHRGIKVSSAILSKLAREGWLRVEVSGRNYRTVRILQGDAAGLSTKPNGQKPWRVIPSAQAELARAKREAPRPVTLPDDFSVKPNTAPRAR